MNADQNRTTNFSVADGFVVKINGNDISFCGVMDPTVVIRHLAILKVCVCIFVLVVENKCGY
jgi:hypothetical protein